MPRSAPIARAMAATIGLRPFGSMTVMRPPGFRRGDRGPLGRQMKGGAIAVFPVLFLPRHERAVPRIGQRTAAHCDLFARAPNAAAVSARPLSRPTRGVQPSEVLAAPEST